MLTDPQRANLAVLFQALDATGDGLITLDDATARADQVCAGFDVDETSAAHREIQAAYRQAWDALVRFADADKDGAISLEEYLDTMDRGMLADPQYVDSSVLVITNACFEGADSDGDGMIDLDEYTRGFVVIDPSMSELARAGFDLLDTDGDGLISRAELIAAMRMAISGGEVPEAFGGSVVR